MTLVVCLASVVAALKILVECVPLTAHHLEGCSFEIVTTESRPLPVRVRFMIPANYWAMATAINSDYAMRFGYDFKYVQLNKSLFQRSQACDYHPTWGKVFYIQERLQELQESGDRCTWLLFLDSDAFVREADLSIPSFLISLSSRYKIQHDVAAIFAQSRDIVNPNMVTTGPLSGFAVHISWLNAGVFFVQANHHSRKLFDAWKTLGAYSKHSLRRSWPGETGVISELLQPGLYPFARTPAWGEANYSNNVAIVDMVEMDSPWGRFVAHIWGYHWYRREIDFWDALIRIHADNVNRLQQLLLQSHINTKHWGPKTGNSTGCLEGTNRNWKRVFWSAHGIPRGGAPCQDKNCDIRSAAH